MPQPNILFLFPDQHRFDWIGSNPDIPVRTPVLDRLEAGGTRFTHAVTPSPLCAPARACLASGKEYVRCGVSGNEVDYPLDQPTFYQTLRDGGYHVMGCGKFDLHKPTHDWGLDGKRQIDEWGFSDGIDNEGKMDGTNSGKDAPKGPYLQFLEERGLREAHVADFNSRNNASTFPTPLPDAAYCDNWIGNNGIELIRSAPESEPWFLQVNFTGPHNPWDITQGMTELYSDEQFPPAFEHHQFDSGTINAVRQNYSAMVENIDLLSGLLINEVEKRGELDNTLIVFSSDHGEMLGDHNLWGKTHPHQASVGVPLVIKGPNVQRALTCTLPTTILDLTATFLEFAGLTVPEEMDSHSMKPLLNGETASHREHVFSAVKNWQMVSDGKLKLISGYRENDFLFDLQNDPMESTNLAVEKPDEVERLGQYLSRSELSAE